jgi:hypothetical protein
LPVNSFTNKQGLFEKLNALGTSNPRPDDNHIAVFQEDPATCLAQFDSDAALGTTKVRHQRSFGTRDKILQGK